jgi:predicted RNase H-related nuclease YkuK (DUF458 family)
MESFSNGYFYNPSRGNLSFEGVVKEIISWMRERPEKTYEVIVGCDSSSGEDPHFPIAVVVLRRQEGGRFFLKKVHYSSMVFGSWRQRILQEVVLSCELALSLRERLQEAVGKSPELNYEFRYIHADVGENGKTKDMIREVTGLIRGNGFEPKIKPESYAASVVADRYS